MTRRKTTAQIIIESCRASKINLAKSQPGFSGLAVKATFASLPEGSKFTFKDERESFNRVYGPFTKVGLNYLGSDGTTAPVEPDCKVIPISEKS